MSRVLILYYSSYGHVEAMAKAVAEGVAEAGSTPTVRRTARPAANERDSGTG